MAVINVVWPPNTIGSYLMQVLVEQSLPCNSRIALFCGMKKKKGVLLTLRKKKEDARF